MFHSLLILSAALVVPPPDGQWRILRFPVLVEARVIEGEPESKDSMGFFDFQIEVRDAKESIRLESTVIAVRDLPDALRILHDTIVWRAPYLFVRVECGGGNAWACNRDVVFRVNHDRATQLGSFAVTDKRLPALSFRDGYFVDIYDKLESAYIGLCHACLPSFDLVLTDHDGFLQVESDATWTRNQEQFLRTNERIADLLTRVIVVADRPVCDDVPEDSGQLYKAAVANAVLAKYCRRDHEVDDLLAKVIEHLDSEQRRGLHEALALVVPLELPRGWRE